MSATTIAIITAVRLLAQTGQCTEADAFNPAELHRDHYVVIDQCAIPYTDAVPVSRIESIYHANR